MQTALLVTKSRTAVSHPILQLRPLRRHHTVPPHDGSRHDEHGKTQSDERPQDLHARAGEPSRVQREQPGHQGIAGAPAYLRTNPEKPAVIAVEMHPRLTHDHAIADDGPIDDHDDRSPIGAPETSLSGTRSSGAGEQTSGTLTGESTRWIWPETAPDNKFRNSSDLTEQTGAYPVVPQSRFPEEPLCFASGYWRYHWWCAA